MRKNWPIFVTLVFNLLIPVNVFGVNPISHNFMLAGRGVGNLAKLLDFKKMTLVTVEKAANGAVTSLIFSDVNPEKIGCGKNIYDSKDHKFSTDCFELLAKNHATVIKVNLHPEHNSTTGYNIILNGKKDEIEGLESAVKPEHDAHIQQHFSVSKDEQAVEISSGRDVDIDSKTLAKLRESKQVSVGIVSFANRYRVVLRLTVDSREENIVLGEFFRQ
jgi:hypothetical protein